MKNIINILKVCLILTFISVQYVSSEENKVIEIDKEHEWNFYSGMFDFSDDGKRATLFGLQHQNESLTRDSFFWNDFTCDRLYDDIR